MDLSAYSGKVKVFAKDRMTQALAAEKAKGDDFLKEEAAKRGADAVVMQGPVKVTKEPDGSTSRRLAAWAIRLSR